MSGVTIHPAGTPQLLKQQIAELRAAAREAMGKAVQATAEEMRHLAPGSIGEHIEERVGAGGPGVVTGSVFPTDAWAKYVDEGTGMYVPFHHEIRAKHTRPRAAMRLRDGRFRKVVRGQRGQHFRDRTVDAVEDRVIEILEYPAIEVTDRLAHP